MYDESCTFFILSQKIKIGKILFIKETLHYFSSQKNTIECHMIHFKKVYI